jgi:hypothetical protein
MRIEIKNILNDRKESEKILSLAIVLIAFQNALPLFFNI